MVWWRRKAKAKALEAKEEIAVVKTRLSRVERSMRLLKIQVSVLRRNAKEEE